MGAGEGHEGEVMGKTLEQENSGWARDTWEVEQTEAVGGDVGKEDKGRIKANSSTFPI